MSNFPAPRIPILHGRSDWHEWSFRVKSIILEKNRLAWGRVTGEAVMPTSTTTKAFKDWQVAGDEAICILFQGLTGDLFRMVCHFDCPRKIWTTLEDLLGQVNVWNLVGKFQELEQGSRSTDDWINFVLSKRNQILYHASCTDPPTTDIWPLEPQQVAETLVVGLSNDRDDQAKDIAERFASIKTAMAEHAKKRALERAAAGLEPIEEDIEEQALFGIIRGLRFRADNPPPGEGSNQTRPNQRRHR